MIISYIVKIALEYNEKHTKTRTSSNRKVGKIRPKRACKRNFSKNSSSEGSISQVKNQQGQGIQKKMMIPQNFPQLSLIKKNKGLELLKLLRKNDNIKFNKKGEICYKGKLLKRSNVYDLINHAIHTNRSHPVHMKNFYKILAKIVIPNKLIKNKEGRNIMNKEIHDIDNRWRPPGCLK